MKRRFVLIDNKFHHTVDPVLVERVRRIKVINEADAIRVSE